MTSPNQPRVRTFERVREYKAVLEDSAQLASHRQTLNNVYVGINTLFLTGLGIFLFNTSLTSWVDTWIVGAITVVVLPMNLTWRAALVRYRTQIGLHLEYLREIEMEFRARRAMDTSIPPSPTPEPPIGFFMKLQEARHPHTGNTRLEILMATYFLILYPVITLAVGALTFLIMSGVLSPFKLS
jgi:hypothetical protein